MRSGLLVLFLACAGCSDWELFNLGESECTHSPDPCVWPALGFLQQPVDVAASATMTPAIRVGFRDSRGRATTAGGSVTITLQPVGSDTGLLRGTRTVAPIDGIATFADLRVDRGGQYRLHASAAHFQAVYSHAFVVTAP